MNSPDKGNRFGLWLIVLYMFLEYVRPQSFVPGLAALHIPMLVQIAIIILLLLQGNIERLKSRESFLFFLLICLMAFHIPFARNNYWAYMITKTMALQLIVFLGIVGFLRTYRDLNLVLTFWVVIAVLSGLEGYSEGGMVHGSAFMGDENDFSLFMNMMIPLAFFKGHNASAAKAKIVWYGGVIVLILGTVSSLSRGGFIGLLPPLLFCWWKTPGKVKTGFASVLVVLILLIYVIPDSYWEEMRTITQEGTQKGTGSHRIYMWQRSWEMFLDHPLVGVGPGNAPHNFAEYEPYGGLNGRSEAGRAVHSIYFTLIPELGLAGTFLFFGLILSNLKERARLRKRKHELRATHFRDNHEAWQAVWTKIENLDALGWGLMGAVIAYLISGAFLSVLYYGHFWLIMGFSVARNNVVRELHEELEGLPEETPDLDISTGSDKGLLPVSKYGSW